MTRVQEAARNLDHLFTARHSERERVISLSIDDKPCKFRLLRFGVSQILSSDCGQQTPSTSGVYYVKSGMSDPVT